MAWRRADFLNALASLRVEGPTAPPCLEGAYRVAPAGMVNPYFANLGLYHFVGDYPEAIREYLEGFLGCLRDHPGRRGGRLVMPDFVEPDYYGRPRAFAPRDPDSHDAYCATFLLLAAEYVETTDNAAWLRTFADRIKEYAEANLLALRKPSGLCRVFQSPNENGSGYLMDNAENQAGLRRFARALDAIGDPDAERFREASEAVRIGINRLFVGQPGHGRWQISDLTPNGDGSFYPDATCQLFPALFVNSPDPTSQLRYEDGHRRLGSLPSADEWWDRPRDPAGFPWAVLGFYTALRRPAERAKAVSQLDLIERLFRDPATRARVPIHDLGWAYGTYKLLNGLGSSDPLA
ncbi:MAG: hypothetical protein KIS66_00260 [Fimbriimonadaceae bacterium]|nr:hypothetical protein [Fimbriimonadaceae bacterium]